MTADNPLNRAIALQRSGNLPGAARLYAEILVREPDNIQVRHVLGIAYTQMEDYASAIACLRRCLALDPNSADIANSLGMALFPAGQRDEALACFEKALALNPRHAKAANNLGNAHLRSNNVEQARKAFERALEIKADYLEARVNLAQCLLITEDYDDALRAFEAVLRQNPAYQPALEGSAKALQLLERYEDTVDRRRQLLALDATDPVRHVELGLALKAADRHVEAIACFDKAAAIDRGYAAAHANAGIAQLELGKLDDAYRSFESASRIDPSVSRYRHLLVTAKKVERTDGIVESLQRALERAADAASEDRLHLHFALAKSLADIGETARSFDHTREANRLQRSLLKYDEQTTLAQIARMSERFSPETLARLSGAGDPSRTPVFIVGMPRTGSTLVEQILAGHPDVFAIGESPALRSAVHAISKRKRSEFPNWLDTLTRDDISGLAAQYLSQTRRVAGTRKPGLALSDRLRIVDKMPGNFLFIGLAHLALPNARFIHTRRDPIETCLSGYRAYFEHIQYASDLSELGRYYRQYQILMDRWHAVLPPNLILDVKYETLIDDFENGARSIVSHCGLGWDDACLSFRDVARPVRTASIAQVRQPLSRASLTSWHPADEILAPLRDALGI